MRISDWSSDVCSSDLLPGIRAQGTKLVMLAGIVVETAADTTDVTGMRETRQRHVARAARNDVDEPRGRKHPAPALAAPTLLNTVYRKSVGQGTCVAVRVDIGGRSIIITKKR